ISNKLFLSAETGFSVISRKGFEINGFPAINNSSYIGIVLGAGVEYKFNDYLSIGINALYFPANSKQDQPHTDFFSAGFKYHPNLQNLPPDKKSRHFFPKHFLQAAFSTNTFGY